MFFSEQNEKKMKNPFKGLWAALLIAGAFGLWAYGLNFFLSETKDLKEDTATFANSNRYSDPGRGNMIRKKGPAVSKTAYSMDQSPLPKKQSQANYPGLGDKSRPQAPLELYTSFWAAVKKGDLITLEHLLQEGVNPDLLDKNGATALSHAAENQDLPLLTLLVKQGADINRITESRTALMTAAAKGDARLVEALLDMGADIKVEMEAGQTALHFGIMGGNLNVVKLLLEKGADINHSTADGSTALMIACDVMENTGMVKLLIDKGADVSRRNEKGLTAMDYAENRDSETSGEILALLHTKSG